MTRPPSTTHIRGDRAECLFMAEAMRRGLYTAKLFNQSAGYDVLVDSGSGPIWRVQVKLAQHTSRRKLFSIPVRRGRNRARPITPADADFVEPFSTWYIIPVPAFSPLNAICIFPEVAGSRSKYERFRDAWHLLRL